MKLSDTLAEQHVIRYLIDHPTSYYENIELFSAENLFLDPVLSDIFKYIVFLLSKRESISRLVILSKFENVIDDKTWLITDDIYIKSNKELTATLVELVAYAKRRNVLDILNFTKDAIREDKSAIDRVIDSLIGKLIISSRGKRVTKPQEIHELSEKNLIKIREGLKLKTGISGLDSKLHGFVKGHIWILGAYTGVGKTWMAIHWLKQLLEQNSRVALFSFEMAADENYRRLMGTVTGKGVEGFFGGHTEDDLKKIDDFLKKYGNQFEIFDYCRTINEIAVECKRMMLEGGLDVIFIDFIQNVQPINPHHHKIYDAMREVSLLAQNMAKDLGICVVLLSQLSNNYAKDGGVFQYKGAGEIAQIADVALMMFDATEDYISCFGANNLYKNGIQKKPVEIEIVKHRHGKIGRALAMFLFGGGQLVDILEESSENWTKEKNSGDDEEDEISDYLDNY